MTDQKGVKMKKLLLVGLSIVYVMTQGLYAKTKRYDVASGMVVYTISGSGNIMGITHTSSGHKTLYFEDYGNIQVEETEETSTTMGRTEKNHELVKIQDGMVYTVDFRRKVIIKQDMSMLMKNKDMQKIGKEMLKSMGGKKVGNDTVLGFPCEVWELMGSKIWMHKGVTLKVESNIMGMTHKEVATEVKFGMPVPADKLKLPDYPIQSLEEMMQHEMGQGDGEAEMPTPEEMKQMQEMMQNMFGGKN